MATIKAQYKIILLKSLESVMTFDRVSVMTTRRHTQGSLYQRADGMWIGTVEVGTDANGKRKRRTVSSKDRETAQARLLAITPAYGTPPPTRAELMAAARKLGTHTAAEWGKKVSAVKSCRYCKTSLNMFNVVKDHMIAVESGGSDSIDNVQPICWECNVEKSTTPPDEYKYMGTKPRPFSILPIRRDMYDAMMVSRRSFNMRRTA